jgi:predicted nucleic acid-binding protein
MSPIVRKLTFADASVLINAARGADAARKMRALAVLGDPNRDFAATKLLKLKVLPIAVRYKLQKEVQFYERFFRAVTVWVDVDSSLLDSAYKLACNYGLGAMDALHLAASEAMMAEFDSAERITKPIYAASANVVTIY